MWGWGRQNSSTVAILLSNSSTQLVPITMWAGDLIILMLEMACDLADMYWLLSKHIQIWISYGWPGSGRYWSWMQCFSMSWSFLRLPLTATAHYLAPMATPVTSFLGAELGGWTMGDPMQYHEWCPKWRETKHPRRIDLYLTLTRGSSPLGRVLRKPSFRSCPHSMWM